MADTQGNRPADPAALPTPIEAVRAQAISSVRRLLAFCFLPVVLIVGAIEWQGGRVSPALMVEVGGIVLAVAGAYLTLRRPLRIQAMAGLVPATLAGVGTLFHFGPQGGVVAGAVLLTLYAQVVFRWWGSLLIIAVISVATVVAGTLFAMGAAIEPSSYDITRPQVWIRVIATAALSMLGVALLYEASFRSLENAYRAQQDALHREREADQARAAAERALESARQLEVLGRIAGGVAHDVNNALTIVLGNAELIESTEDRGERELLRSELVAAANSAAETTRQLLTVSQRSPRRHVTVMAAEAVDRFGRTLNRLLPADVEVELHIAGTRSIAVDANLLNMALLNLAVNARDAMPAGGTLVLGAADDPAGGVQIWVEDTGLGMDDETRRRAVEPFFTTKLDGRGTGLGLHMVHDFVTTSGGTFAISSAPGRGTRIAMTFPSVAPGSPTMDDTQGVSLAGLRVLVAEDEEPIQDLLRRHLTAAGGAVVVARNAAEAIRLLEQDRYDLLVTDAIMPGGGTVDLIDTFRRRGSGGVLLVSGHVEQDLIRRGIDAGTVPYLAKPFTRERLLAAVSQALNAAAG